MKSFKQLREDVKEKNGIVFTFGRFQPPTQGHELVINKVVSLAKQHKYDNMIYASQSQDNKRNPLSWKDKRGFLVEMFPKANISFASAIKNPFDVLTALYNENYQNVIMIVGSDRVQEFKSAMKKYVKDFDSFKIISAGTRNNSSGVSGLSGSKMRAFVLKNDYISFSAGLPKSYRNGKKLFEKLQKELG